LQLNSVAESLEQACNKDYEELVAAGIEARRPVIICRHMDETERTVYRQHASDKRAIVRREVKPPYYDSEDDDGSSDESFAGSDNGTESGSNDPDNEPGDDEVEKARVEDLIQSMLTDIRLQNIVKSSNTASFDKRLRLDHLSEGRWILRRAGYVSPGEEPHWIAAEPRRHAEFRLLLARWGDGEDLDKQEIERMTVLANVIVAELANLADCICMTPDVVSQSRAHRLRQPFAFLHDETGKTSECGTLAPLLFSRPYTSGGVQGRVRVRPNSHCRHVMFGDVLQPAPVLGPNAGLHPFGQQVSVALYNRFILDGMSTVWLWEQHCSIELITSCNINLTSCDMLL
jgi:hypothetical protein